MTNPADDAGGTRASDAATSAPTPTPAYPPAYYAGYPGYAARPVPRVNAIAIWSLVASALGLLPFLFGLPSVIGVALGVVALNRIRFTGESGRGLAIAGVAVGAVTFLVSWLIGIAFLIDGPELR
jgi:hypothetical protein